MIEGRKWEVRLRADLRCEYCRIHQRNTLLTHHVEHIIAAVHGGTDELDNLALACHRCNIAKGPNLTGIDPRTRKIVELFHPRRDDWRAHFSARMYGEIKGLTPIGRATVQTLNMNHPRRVQLRRLIFTEDPNARG